MRRTYSTSVGLTNTLTTNLLNPPTTSGGVGSFTDYGNCRITITHMRIVNTSGTSDAVSLWIGASGGNTAGTEFAWNAQALAGNTTLDWYGERNLDVSDFLVGGSTNGTITLDIDGDIMVA